MTPQEINIACATEVGWTDCHDFTNESDRHGRAGRLYGTCPIEKVSRELPNYHGDANAALGLCELMAKEGVNTTFLNRMLINTWECCSNDGVNTHRSKQQTFPAAICECFLRVKGKWKE